MSLILINKLNFLHIINNNQMDMIMKMNMKYIYMMTNMANIQNINEIQNINTY